MRNARMDSAAAQSAGERSIRDFVHNRLPQHHEAFSSSPSRSRGMAESDEPLVQKLSPSYHPAGSTPTSPDHTKNASRAVDDANHQQRGPGAHRPTWTDPKAMLYWNSVFPEALAEFNATTTEPKGRSETGYDIRGSGSWDAIYKTLENARTKYQGDGGRVSKLRRAWRKTSDHAETGAEAFRHVAQIAPDHLLATPVIGSLQVVLDAVKTAAEVRGQVMESLENLLPAISDVELFLSTYPEDAHIQKAAVKLAVAMLDAIERAVGFFIGSETMRGAKALGLGSHYERRLVESLDTVQAKSKALMDEASKSHMFYSQQVGQQLLDSQAQMAEIFRDHILKRDREIQKEREAHQREMQAARSEIVVLQIENGQLRSVSPGLQHYPRTPEPQQQLAYYTPSYVSRDIVRQFLGGLLGMNDMDLQDQAFVHHTKDSLPPKERVRAEQVTNSQLFRDFITTPQSSKLLVHWDRELPKVHAGVSPLSVYATSMCNLLQSHDRFIPVTWYCGLHDDPYRGPVGSRAVIASIADQLLRQFDFSPGSLPVDMIDIAGVQTGNFDALLALLDLLVRQLPETITVVFLIDGAIFYEREELDGLAAFSAILRMTGDSGISAALKVLFMSTPGTDTIRGAFEEEDLILNVHTLPRMPWIPSEDRMQREFSGNLGY